MYNIEYKICPICKNKFYKNGKRYFSKSQWESAIFCSRQCCGISQRKNDGYKSRNERWRRKNNIVEKGTDECSQKISEATRLAMKMDDVQNKIRKPRSPLSTEHKKKIGDSLVGRKPTNLFLNNNGNQIYSHVNRGWFDIDGEKMFFRSRWEANYALYLSYLKNIGEIKEWKYENKIFIFDKIQFGIRSYRPDFEVLKNDDSIEYHEVKGWMNKPSKTKISRMKRYYSHVKLIIIDKNIYNDIIKENNNEIEFFK